jgi:hypothetical protein
MGEVSVRDPSSGESARVSSDSIDCPSRAHGAGRMDGKRWAAMMLEEQRTLVRGRVGAVLGLTSAALLVASLRWAHEWGPRTTALVGAWGLATIAAAVVSCWSLDTSRDSQRFAAVGLALALVSVLALPVVGILYAAGVDVAEACGGG